MDRNGKKPKATTGADAHLERSDTKGQTRDALGKAGADAHVPAARGEGAVASPRAKGGSKGPRR